MKFIFVIQQLLRTCQGHRLDRPLDGVKSTSKPVNFCFTLAQLSSCINHIISSFRVMLATSILFALCINASFAQVSGDYKSVGSGNWNVAGTWARYNGSIWITSPTEGWPGQNAGTGAVTISSGINVNINTLTTNPLGTVTIDGTLTINVNQNPILNTQLLIVTPTIGKIDFGSKAKITLPANAALNVTTGGLSGTCNNNNEIIIGTITYSYCAGGGKDHVTFSEVEAQGGTGVFGSNSPICLGSTINLWASPPPLVYGIITYAWSGPGVWTSTSQNTASIASATVAMGGSYKVVMTGNDKPDGTGTVLTVTRNLDVNVTDPPTTANAGPDQTGATTCGLTTVTLAANTPVAGTGAWTILTGAGGTVTTQTSPVSTFTGTTGTAYTLRWTISADCAVSTDDVNITINANNTINLNSAPGTNAQNICINTPITDITYAVGGSATGATVSVLPAGLTGVYNSGVFTISGTPTVSGTFNYTVTATGGCGTATATGSITVTPTVGKPVFTLGASSARDQGVGPVTYTATATGATGITYSLDVASLAGGNTINASTGEVTYKALWSWKSIITATASGCNGPKTADHIVGVNWCYALFTANGALSCAGASVIKGNIGTFVGATTGFTGPGTLVSPGHIDAEATPASAQAAAQTVAVYNDLAAIPCGTSPAGITLAGSTTLTPNVYCYGGALTITGDITLNGGPNAVFIFKINGALTTNTGSKIIMAGGASFRNVYWRVYGAVVLSGLEFKGTIVNEGAFTVNTGVALEGRALSINGAIAITDNAITSDCYPLFTEIDNTKPIFVPPGDFTECVENLTDMSYDPLNPVLNPDQPAFYTFSHGDTRLNLDTDLFTDEIPFTCTPLINWQIDFSPASNIDPPYNLVTKASVTGAGQPSEIIGTIRFPSDGVNFTNVVHHITWWITDCDNHKSAPQTRTITIKPRPSIL